MNEKAYKVIGGSGAVNIAFGIISIVVGITTGIFLIVTGARLLGSRKNVII